MKFTGVTFLVSLIWACFLVTLTSTLAASGEVRPKKFVSSGILCTPEISVSIFGDVEFDRMSAQKLAPLALFKMGYRFYYGDEVKRDYESAIRMLKLGADRGNAEATYLLAAAYLEGNGVSVDKARAQQLLKASEGLGCLEASVMLGVLANLDDEPERAFEYYQKASMKNSLMGMAHEAYSHVFGLGTEIDRTRAVQLLSVIDEARPDYFSITNAEAYSISSEMHRRERIMGYGGQRVRELIQKAATAGNRTAQNRMALLHLEGIYGFEVDLKKTFFWAKKAACQFHPDSTVLVGDAFARGLVVKRDEVMALRWYRSSLLDWKPDPGREFIDTVRSRVEPLQNGSAKDAVHTEFSKLFINDDMEQFVFEQCN